VSASERNAWQCLSRIEHRMRLQKAVDAACDQVGVDRDLY